MNSPQRGDAAESLARWIVHHPGKLLTALAVLVLAAGSVLFSRTAFDADILNLLPPGQTAVEGLREYERAFTQSNELAFLLVWDEPGADTQEARIAFAEELKQQPWVQRVLAEKPLQDGESPAEMVVPLLWNLPPEDFKNALQNLAPENAGQRLQALASAAATGSPRALFELQNDPFGLGTAALNPLWESLALQNAFDLRSPDGTMEIVPCVTRPADNSPAAAVELMGKVRAFIKAAESQLGPDGPKILVTGRAAYVDEISTSMERDIKLTSVVSLAAVIGLFWLGFRRIVPLLAIAGLLALSAVLSTACGSLIFGQLNVVAIGFCSILFGLGDDFSLLICQRYYSAAATGLSREQAVAGALRKAGPGILWVSLTTALGFLALCFAGSPGFRQLGTLVAIGVILATLLMLAILPVFLRGSMREGVNDSWFSSLARNCAKHASSLFLAGCVISVAGFTISALPWNALHFDLSPSSLEPSRTPAAKALALMMSKFPDSFEPAIAVINPPEPKTMEALAQVLEKAKADGLVSRFSRPDPLVLQAANFQTNSQTAAEMDFPALVASLTEQAEQAGIDPAALAPAFATLQALKHPAQPRWDAHLGEDSPWWFLVDRMLSPDGKVAASQIQTSPAITPEQRLELERRVSEIPGVRLTGWSQTLASLVPWAQGELVVFGSLVVVVIALLLAAVYRHLHYWALHAFAMAASLALSAALLKILNVPINILNVLAFPLILGVGVDYGTHIILAVREKESPLQALADVIKPVIISGLTTFCGFGALVFAVNPSLSGLGAVCAIGVASSLLLAVFVVAPGACLIARLADLEPSR